jgi:hypothetical protein
MLLLCNVVVRGEVVDILSLKEFVRNLHRDENQQGDEDAFLAGATKRPANRNRRAFDEADNSHDRPTDTAVDTFTH